MNMYRNARTAALAAAVLTAAACGSDSPAGPEDGGQITQARAEAMIDALAGAGGFGMGSVGGAYGAPSRASYGPINVSESSPCPEGGSIQLDGSYAVDAADDGTGSYTLDLTQTHHGCKATASSDGSSWTFDGSPNVAVHFVMGIGQTDYTLSGTQKGGIAWQSGGDSGTCSLDVTYDFSGSQNGQAFSGQITGTVCGFDVSQSLDLTTN